MVEALSFVVGVICTIALLFLTYIPGRVADANREINALTAELTATEDTLSRTIQNAERDIEQLEWELDEARENYRRIASVIATEDQVQRVDLGWSYIWAGNHLEAAQIFDLIDPIGMDDNTRGRFEEGREISFEAASAAAYNDGWLYFSNNDYVNARRAFDTSLRFVADDPARNGGIFFYLGSIAEREGDTELAIEYFTRVVEEFPNAPVRPMAEQELERLSRQ